MDALTHGLASFAITRAVFPRASRVTLVAAVFAGVVADLDQFSAYASPSAFLAWHRIASHSVVGTLVIVMALSMAAWLIRKGKPAADSMRVVSLALLATSLLHVAMDLTQNESVQLLWPFRIGRYSADWVAHFDLWILVILLAGALLPQLLALVTEEIGAKSKGPRGRIGAFVALLLVFAYVGTRNIFHGNAVATMENRTYRGESPRRVAAFAESDSPLHWRGLVETERAFHELDLALGPGSSFSPDAAVISYKPESSAALEAARGTESVRRFLQAARFPKASVEKTQNGFRVEIRDLAEQRDARSAGRVVAIVETDGHAIVLDDELAWDQRI
jgi:membrane-bound metal-dependent hydrolase YbcI (DUF457 family)